MNDGLSAIGLRDKNGKMIHGGDRVKVMTWRGFEFVGSVHYDNANACWCIDQYAICNLERNKGTTLEVVEAPLAESKPLKSRRKGKPS